MKHALSALFSRKGFTIIELAIVLIIAGVLISLGMSMMGPVAKRAKVSDTQGIIDGGLESLKGFAATNRRLPTTAQFAGVVQKSMDSWGNALYYVVDANLAPAAPVALTDYICGRKTTTITVRSCINDGCTTYTDTPNVAFVIISGGENFNVQTALATGTVTVYVQNGATNRDSCTTAANCPNYSGTMINRSEKYDDIVKWVTLEELRSKTGCAGQQLVILNNELPPGSTATTYVWNVNPLGALFVQGGVQYGTANQNYKWCIQTAAPAGLVFRNTAGADITSSLFNASCSTYARASWPQSDTIIISGRPTAQGSYRLIVFARDNNDPTAGTNDSIAQKPFVLTIGP